MTLSEKRKELNSRVWDKKTFPIDILREVEKQDKEFIKELKESDLCNKNWKKVLIDQFAGEELVK